MISNQSFVSFSNASIGLLFDDSQHESYPIRYHHVVNGQGLSSCESSSYFGFVYQGSSIEKGITATLIKDTYFSHAGLFSMSGNFRAVVIEVLSICGYYKKTGYRAQTSIGGPVEPTGRLRYIDGCTDSLLVPPVKKGDPCLNHLHFPENIVQTPHTHPSHRIGIVIRGEGECVTPFGSLPLLEGCIFLIKEYDGHTSAVGNDGLIYEAGTHKFNTQGSSLDVIAFHPDSDFGPEDDCHPMINRTIVNGVSARELTAIRTV
jgi:hypothetical protein